MVKEEELDESYSFDDVHFSYITASDVVSAIKKVFRNCALSHRNTAPRIKAMSIYLFRRIKDSNIDYTNEYLRLCLDISHRNQINFYTHRHKDYWKQEKKYRMRVALAMDYLRKRESLKKELFHKEYPFRIVAVPQNQ
jgi:hypothetical protein